MKAYLDSSVILRRLLGEEHALKELDKIHLGTTSQITRLECVRTLDRLLIRQLISAEEFADLKKNFFKVFSRLEIILCTDPLMTMAESSFSVPLGTLDSIHLSSAILWQREKRQPLNFFTHDKELSLAARANGFEVTGT